MLLCVLLHLPRIGGSVNKMIASLVLVSVIFCRHGALAFVIPTTPASSRRHNPTSCFSTSTDQEAPAATASQANNQTSQCDCLYIEEPDYIDGTRPENALLLGLDNFRRQGSSIVQEALASVGINGKNYVDPNLMPPNCLGLTLDSEAVREAERRREARAGEKVETNPVSRALYDVGCYCLDELFEDRPIARFWFLETIARCV